LQGRDEHHGLCGFSPASIVGPGKCGQARLRGGHLEHHCAQPSGPRCPQAPRPLRGQEERNHLRQGRGQVGARDRRQAQDTQGHQEGGLQEPALASQIQGGTPGLQLQRVSVFRPVQQASD